MQTQPFPAKGGSVPDKRLSIRSDTVEVPFGEKEVRLSFHIKISDGQFSMQYSERGMFGLSLSRSL